MAGEKKKVQARQKAAARKLAKLVKPVKTKPVKFKPVKAGAAVAEGRSGGGKGTKAGAETGPAKKENRIRKKKWTRKMITRGKGYSSLNELERQYYKGYLGRGPQKAPKKILISIRLSPEVVREFRAMGRGWQVRVDEVLKDWLSKRV